MGASLIALNAFMLRISCDIYKCKPTCLHNLPILKSWLLIILKLCTYSN